MLAIPFSPSRYRLLNFALQYIQQNIRSDCANIDKILEPPEGQDEGVWKYEHLRYTTGALIPKNYKYIILFINVVIYFFNSLKKII